MHTARYRSGLSLAMCLALLAAFNGRAHADVAAQQPATSDPKPLVRGGSTAARPAASTTGGVSQWVRTGASLAAVVALIVLLAWGYRKAAGLPMTGSRVRNLGLIEVVSRTSLSPRASLWLVRVGPRLVLIGGANDQLRSLDVITDSRVVSELLGAAAQRSADGSSAAFATALERESVGYAEPPSSTEPAARPEAPQLDAVRKKLARALERLQGTASA